MSAFNVSTGTINRIANLLNPLNAEAGEELCGKLQRLNAEAVAWRYNEKPEYTTPLRYTHSFSYSQLELIKAAHCWIYQCSEGDFPDDDLFKRVEEAVHSAEESYVSNLDEYDALPWDFPIMMPSKHNP